MRTSAAAFLAALIMGALALAPTSAPAGATEGAATATSAPAVGLLANRTGDLAATSDPGRYGYVILKPDQYHEIASIKAANPDAVVLMYKDMASTRSYAVTDGVDHDFISAGVGWVEADSEHPEWFLVDGSGARIEWRGYAGHWWMDIGSAAYQDRWLSNVAAEIEGYGWDGVMVDNANAHRGSYLAAGQTIASYPDDASYAEATESFLGRVGPALRTAGHVFVPNISFKYSADWKDLYARWTGYTSGTLREFWMKPGMTSTGHPRFADGNWRYMMDQMEVVQSQGKVYLPVTYGAMDDIATQTYGRASFLLGWHGGSSAYIWTPETADTDSWGPVWTADIGLPLAPRYSVAGVWRRDFTGGAVVVNPSSTLAATVPLGATFKTVSGELVASVTLAPATAVILRTLSDEGGATTTTTTMPTTTTVPSPVVTTTTTVPATTTTTAAPRRTPRGKLAYRVVRADGAAFVYEDGRRSATASVPVAGGQQVVAGAARPSGGGWVVTATGAVHSLAGAPWWGDLTPHALNQPIVGMAASPSGRGYWLVAADGGIFSFGDAGFFGSTGAMRLNQPIVGMAASPAGRGYWFVAADGGIFSFGDAGFFGSTGDIRLSQPITSMAATPTGAGYWFVAADGGVFSFGDATFLGAPTGQGAPFTALLPAT